MSFILKDDENDEKETASYPFLRNQKKDGGNDGDSGGGSDCGTKSGPIASLSDADIGGHSGSGSKGRGGESFSRKCSVSSGNDESTDSGAAGHPACGTTGSRN